MTINCYITLAWVITWSIKSIDFSINCYFAITHLSIFTIVLYCSSFLVVKKSCLHCSIICVKYIPVTIYILLSILHLSIWCIIYCLILTWDSHKACLHYTFTIKHVPITLDILLTCLHRSIKCIEIICLSFNILESILHLA